MQSQDIDQCRGLTLLFMDNQEVIMNGSEAPCIYSRHQRDQFIAAMKCIELDFIQENQQLKKDEIHKTRLLFSLFYKTWGEQCPTKKENTLSNHEISIAKEVFINLNDLMKMNNYSFKTYHFLNNFTKQVVIGELALYSTNNKHMPTIQAKTNKTYPNKSDELIKANKERVILMAPNEEDFEFLDLDPDVDFDVESISFSDLNTTEFISPLHKAYQLPLDIPPILNLTDDSLLSKAKADGYKIISILKPNDVKKTDVFTIINHGTTNTQANMIPTTEEVSILSIVANLLRSNGDPLGNTYMVNDGPGSIADPDLMLSIVNPETDSLITLELPSSLPHITRRVYGALTGYGLDHAAENTLKRLHWLDKLDMLPKKLVLLGFSRGGAQNHYLSNKIAQDFGEKMTIDIFSIDPVPGGTHILDIDKYALPKIVNSAMITIAAHEYRSLFQPITQTWLKLQGDTKVEYISLPGKHDEQRKTSFDSGLFTAHSLAEFLVKNNVIKKDHELYKTFKIDDITNLKDRLEMALSDPVMYQKTGNQNNVDVSALGFVQKLSPLNWRDSTVSDRDGQIIPNAKPTQIQIKEHSNYDSNATPSRLKNKTTSWKPVCHDTVVACSHVHLHTMIQQASRTQSNLMGGTDQSAESNTIDSTVKLLSAGII